MKTLGAEYNAEEYASFMTVWRYTGHLMGIPETILFRDADEALRLYDVALMCEPAYQAESVVMAHSLVNSAPLIAGRSDPAERRSLAQYVYRMSRALIGKEVAEGLMYPPFSSFGAVGWFKVQQRYGHILGKLSPAVAKTVTSSDSRPCSTLHCSTRRESATHCPTTCTRKSPPSGDAGGASRLLRPCRHSSVGPAPAGFRLGKEDTQDSLGDALSVQLQPAPLISRSTVLDEKSPACRCGGLVRLPSRPRRGLQVRPSRTLRLARSLLP